MDFSQPYSTARTPIMADNMVATSVPLATQAGVAALHDGGNAVDAALAAAIALTVVEPNSNGIGSDAFAQVWDGIQLTGLNASGRAPRDWTLARFQERYPSRHRPPRLGWDSVTVPGAVSAWVALSERFGKLPFARLFDAAISYAENGFSVTPRVATAWQLAAHTYRDYPDFAEHFLPAPQVGERITRPDQATTLKAIAQSNGEAFYRGNIAAQIAAAAANAGGALSAADLANHSATWVTPIAVNYRDITLHEIPPNGQGLSALIALGILNHRAIGNIDSEVTVHLQLEAIKIANRAATEHIGDPDSMRASTASLLDEATLARLAAGITEQAAALPPVPVLENPGTVYLCAADAQGMMVSFIQSNYLGFGSGIVVPGTGIALQNRGYGFNLTPGHPNCVGPGKRPFHTIIPGFVTRSGQPLLAFGVMGGHMQHQGHVQMVQRLFDAGQNPQAASDAPRWIVNPDYSVSVEPAFPKTVIAGLRKRGHQIDIEPDVEVFGGAQLIYRTEHGYVAGSDHRKDGQATGF
ncbi:MAG: gamma-glutamyltransferase family protein [Pseudomonadales bacterium]